MPGSGSGPTPGDLSLVPKAELHLHIEGTIEPEHAFQMARQNGVVLPWDSADALRRAYEFTDLQSFLDVYYAVTAVLQTAADFEAIVIAYLDRAVAQGVRHAELFFDPQSHTANGTDIDVVLNGLSRAVARSTETHGVSTSLILCFLRDRGPDEAMATLASAAASPDFHHVSAVGLDSAEVGHPPEDFAAVFDEARRLGLRTVAHAGEEGPPAYVWSALDDLRVERIDHGVRSLEDPALIGRLVSEQVPLTVCPLSNVRLQVVRSIEEHPLPAMLRAGLLVSVNSDDPAYFGGYAGDNFAAAIRGLGLGLDDVRTLARNSFHSAFISERARSDWLAEIDVFLDGAPTDLEWRTV